MNRSILRVKSLSMNEKKRLTSDELLERRRLALLSRVQNARVQLDSLCSLDSSYDRCRDTLRQWRVDMLDHINKCHETSLSQLNNTYEQLNRFRLKIQNILNDNPDLHSKQLSYIQSSLNALRQAEFTFDFSSATQFNGELELLKLSNPQHKARSLDKSNTKCRLLVPNDRYITDVFFYDDLIQRIDYKTPECILICPFDLVGELIGNDQEVRILIDQTYLPSIGSQAQRMRSDYNLSLLQPSQECCPQSSERVIRIICNDQNKLLACLEDIYTICSQQVVPVAYNPYFPSNYDRSKIHLYYGYSDIQQDNSKQNYYQNSMQQHFDRAHMPVPVRETLPITDMQAGALLGPKGERIQQLQRETGAIVTIGDLNDDSDQRRRRIVYIQGNQHQVSSALQAIRKILMIGNNEDDTEYPLKFDVGRIKKY